MAVTTSPEPPAAPGLPVMRTQRGMIDGHLVEPGNPAYTIGFVVEFDTTTATTTATATAGATAGDPLDPTLVVEAVGRLLDDAEALRVRFDVGADGQWRQRVDPARPAVELHDLRDSVNTRAAFDDLVRRRMNWSFDLHGGVLCRFDVAILDGGRTAVCGCAHHAICDGYGSELVRTALLHHVVALASGDPRPPASLGDYGALVGAERPADAADLDFWLDHLRALPTRMAFADDVSAPAPAALTGTVTIPTQGAHPASSIGSSEWWPTVMGLVAMYTATILDEDEAVLGVPLHNRASDLERATPAMVMTELPLRVRIDDAATLGDLTAEVRRALTVIRPHTSMRPESLRHALPSAWRTGRVHGPTVNVFTRPAVTTVGDRTARSSIVDHGPVQDMSIMVAGTGDHDLELRISVNPRTHAAESVGLHLERLGNLIGLGLTLPPTQPIASIPVLIAAEQTAHARLAEPIDTGPRDDVAPQWGRPTSVAQLIRAAGHDRVADGGSVEDTGVRLLNRHGRPVTFGEVGELTLATVSGEAAGLGVVAALTPEGLVYRGRREDRTVKRGRWVERDAPPRRRSASDAAGPDRGVPDPAD